MIFDYPDSLLYIIRHCNSSFIPKKIPENQKYFKLYHKYYCKDFIPTSYFKVIDIFNIDEIQYIELLFSDSIHWLIPNNIIYKDSTYELIYDKNNIMNQDIINSEESFLGYQIIYWFCRKYNKKYYEFKPYIEYNGKSRIQDNCSYFISADFRRGKYINPKIILDRREQK